MYPQRKAFSAALWKVLSAWVGQGGHSPQAHLLRPGLHPTPEGEALTLQGEMVPLTVLIALPYTTHTTRSGVKLPSYPWGRSDSILSQCEAAVRSSKLS